MVVLFKINIFQHNFKSNRLYGATQKGRFTKY